MSTLETCYYKVSLQSKAVGNYQLSTQRTRYSTLLDAKLSLQGSFANQTISQRSKLRYPQLYSLHYREENNDRQHTRSYEVFFDSEQGLVRAIKNGSDKANIPYTVAFQDPLGLLHQVRSLDRDVEQLRVPMLGKSVTVERISTNTLSVMGQDREVDVYIIYPGSNYIYVEVEKPRRIVKLSQRVHQQWLESLLVKVETQKLPNKRPGRQRPRIRADGHRNKHTQEPSESSEAPRGKPPTKRGPVKHRPIKDGEQERRRGSRPNSRPRGRRPNTRRPRPKTSEES